MLGHKVLVYEDLAQLLRQHEDTLRLPPRWETHLKALLKAHFRTGNRWRDRYTCLRNGHRQVVKACIPYHVFISPHKRMGEDNEEQRPMCKHFKPG